MDYRNQRVINPMDGLESIQQIERQIHSEKEEDTFAGKELDLLSLLDRSSSMNEKVSMPDGTLKSKWEVVLDNMRALIQRLMASEELRENVHLTVMVFSTGSEVICEHVRVADIDIDELMGKLVNVHPRGVTALGKSIVKAVEVLDARKAWLREHKRQYWQPILSVLTDGRPTNEEGYYSEQTMSQAYHLIDMRLEERKLTVLPVGIGEDEGEFKTIARLLKKTCKAGEEEQIPLLRTAADIRRYFRYIGATVNAVAHGENVDINAYTRSLLNYKPTRMSVSA